MTRAAQPTRCGSALRSALALYLIVPIGLVILFSFNTSALTSLPLTGLTFDWYRKLFAQDYFLPALQNSLIIAAAVCILSIIDRDAGRARLGAHAAGAGVAHSSMFSLCR